MRLGAPIALALITGAAAAGSTVLDPPAQFLTQLLLPAPCDQLTPLRSTTALVCPQPWSTTTRALSPHEGWQIVCHREGQRFGATVRPDDVVLLEYPLAEGRWARAMFRQGRLGWVRLANADGSTAYELFCPLSPDAAASRPGRR